MSGQENKKALTGRQIQFMKSHLNRAVLSLVTEGNKMIDCCLLEGYNLVLPLRYSPAVNKHPAYSEEATVAGEYVNPERLELSRIQGKASGRTRDWSGAEPSTTQRSGT